MIHYLGNIVDDLIPKSTINKGNKDKSWSYGYNSDHDIIIISKDGTLGTIVNINGLNIGLPKTPDKKYILNSNKAKKDQKWVREDLPKGLNDETQFNPEYRDYIEEEFRRREEGLFAYIKGELIYIVPIYYFTLQWVFLDEGYPDFRQIQNELMLYWEACKADDRCFGVSYVKNRRFGWTSLCIGELVEAGTIVQNKELGIISKESKHAKGIFTKLVRAFKKLPPFFKPLVDGNTTPKTELIFSEPSRKRKAGERIVEEEGLDTVIKWHTTTLNAMDGDKQYRTALDEVGKWPVDVPFSQYWNIVKTSHRQGRRIVGKAMVGSTVNALKKGGQEFKDVYDLSDPLDRTENDRTKSGLYNIFIPTQYCLEGFFDEYGFSIVDDPEKPITTDMGDKTSIGASTYLENDIEALKDNPEDQNEYYRQNPRTIREAFRDEATDCDFNLLKLQEQLDHNEYEVVDNSIERGNLTWKDGIQDTEVIWRPDPNGRFWIAEGCHPPDEFRNKRDKKNINGILSWSPLAAHVGAFGVDPYNRSKTSDGRGSSGSIHLSTKTNTTYLPNEAFILEYIDRPRKVEDFFEDVIKVMVYYSMPALIEQSNEQFLKLIKERGYRNFSMNNPFKLWKDLNPTEKLYGGAPQQDTKIGDQQFYAIESYIEDYVGVARETRKEIDRIQGQMGWMPFSRTLTQWKDVDTTNRTKYDAYISSSLSRLANQKRKLKTETKVKKLSFFTKYNNDTNRSKTA